jgi:large subunit ribosomal protein L34e
LVYLYLKKKRSVPRCAVTKEKLHGITPSRPSERPRMSRRLKTVKRAYGGVLSHKALKERIIRAFLIDEQKVVKVLKAQATVVKAPKAPKPAPKPAAKPAAPAPQKASAKTDKKGGDKKPEKKSIGGGGDKKPAPKVGGGPKGGKIIKK